MYFHAVNLTKLIHLYQILEYFKIFISVQLYINGSWEFFIGFNKYTV